jgi:hypothetical protein
LNDERLRKIFREHFSAVIAQSVRWSSSEVEEFAQWLSNQASAASFKSEEADCESFFCDSVRQVVQTMRSFDSKLKPEIVLINESTKDIIIGELTCPMEARMTYWHETKTKKYQGSLVEILSFWCVEMCNEKTSYEIKFGIDYILFTAAML